MLNVPYRNLRDSSILPRKGARSGNNQAPIAGLYYKSQRHDMDEIRDKLYMVGISWKDSRG